MLKIQIADRLTNLGIEQQKLLNIITDKWMAKEFNLAHFGKPLSSNSKLHINPFKITFKSFLSNFLKTLSLTIYSIYFILFFFNKTRRNSIPDALVYSLPTDLILSNSSAQEMKEFFDDTIFNIRGKRPQKYLVQNPRLTIFSPLPEFQIVRYIGVALLPYTGVKRSKVVVKILGNFFNWSYILIHHPEMIELGAEFVIDSISLGSDCENNFDYLITTQSNMLSLPAAFHFQTKAVKLMYWYSDNSRPIKSKFQASNIDEDNSHVEQNLIDFHFVWTRSWARIMEKYNKGHVIILGPILFKKMHPLTQKSEKLENDTKVLIFDVTPLKSLDKNNFVYSTGNLICFIDDILNVLLSNKLVSQINLKPKRKYKRSNSKKYLRFLESKSRELVTLSPYQDLTNLIISYDLVICIPFTSPALIAKALGKKVIFYFPNDDFAFPDFYEEIPVLLGKKALTEYLL